ncbi:methyltransferase type 12 [Mycobacterium asiaticum]|uniref:Methyltransferase type 12 n=1 Tax=Mycobacterium asiaticum TaxID=1790 RepID=A0A1A3NLI8_MYCAS|nr:class I SAM-dependent methyltransferase [Mycobacterium asiaticum]OBK21914.1 methyltransferase type 12 [Mycobacterium asiaticum]
MALSHRLKHLQYRTLYRLGFVPWDGHPIGAKLRELVEDNGFAPGSALDIGCGTGDNSIYLAKRGWQATGVDYVARALDKARAKAIADGVEVSFVQADVTRLSSAGVGRDFRLIVDSGCLHGMNDDDRDAYVREVTAVASADTRLLIFAMVPGGSPGVRGIDLPEIRRRFTPGWTVLSCGDEPSLDHNGKNPGRYYLLQPAG